METPGFLAASVPSAVQLVSFGHGMPALVPAAQATWTIIVGSYFEIIALLITLPTPYFRMAKQPELAITLTRPRPCWTATSAGLTNIFANDILNPPRLALAPSSSEPDLPT